MTAEGLSELERVVMYEMYDTMDGSVIKRLEMNAHEAAARNRLIREELMMDHYRWIPVKEEVMP